ncbi:hypothetical protein [Sphingosinicella microcystinivorans]|uniref:hypothetical protein n=1 Tax=Sphingosinicella microcystinivorans TaxID=335406 RepID=UPI0022F39614|nr:hypothetical protein [Sphingosinicella microcystinivorans]WBX84451.1 hypothetical protein PE061_00525 [Sphingosinicella microcystinivorans]
MSIVNEARNVRSGTPSVFISGSISIRRLPSPILERLGRVIDREMPVLIGDAPGVDTAVQQYLADRQAWNGTIFCSGSAPRHNIGGWPIRIVRADAPTGTRTWHMAKDREMARLADIGLVIWDGSSAGSFANIERLSNRGCYVLVYLCPDGRFLPLRCGADRAAFLASQRPG